MTLLRPLRRTAGYLRRRAAAILRLAGLRGARQLHWRGPRRSGSTLVVGPGLLTIPPPGWGAVETIIDEMSTELAVTRPTMVLNSDSVRLWWRAFRVRHDAIHVHYDMRIGRVSKWRRLSNRTTPIVAWSHYAYLGLPEVPAPHFDRIWRHIERHLGEHDVFVALNPSIAEMASSRLRARVIMLPNGSDFDPIVETKPTRGVLVLGKVDPRKRQYELSDLVLHDTDLTCVGPIADGRVRDLIARDPTSARSRIFVGEWTRSRLAEEMPRRRVLLLPSDAEADALVLYEAQLAGLSIVCSRPALGAQDDSLPWIHTFDLETSLEGVNELCQRAMEENAIHRTAIMEYARENFGWTDRIERLDRFLASTSG